MHMVTPPNAGKNSHNLHVSTPALIVMLGSTPSKSGMELCQHMLSLSADDCRRVALVHIDTANPSGDLNVFYKEHEGVFRSFHLRITIPQTINYTKLPGQPLHTFIPSMKPQPFANGAGGIRNNGHVAAALNHTKLKQTLEEALHYLELLGTSQGEKRVQEVHVNLVAFLGGGTGSGILPDIAVMVRQLLIERLYEQRINLFCILPDWIQGSNNNDINWRKSNTVACLLELLALSLAANAGGKLTYRKYLLNYAYEVSADPIANEIYLIGRTSMANADDTARIVGLDLFQRIVDASGIGSLEHDTWSNRRALGATDDRGLPTMFATSCPLEVRFPAQETALAFAQLSTSFLLPAMIGQAPPQQDFPEEMSQDWINEWRDVAMITSETQGNPLAVRATPEFAPSEFLNMDQADLDEVWRETAQRSKQTAQIIEARIKQKRTEELQQIAHTPGSGQEQQSQFTRRLSHLRRLKEEYGTMYAEIRDAEVELPDRPEHRASFFHRLPFVGGWFREREARRACNICNTYLIDNARKVRYNLLKALLKGLLKLVEEQVAEVNKWFTFRENRLDQDCKELATMSQNSAAWHGKLDQPHPHQRHLFDLDSLQTFGQDGNGLAALERLYMAVTFPVRDENQVLLGSTEQHYSKEYVQTHIDRYIEDCSRMLNKGTQNVDLRSRENFSQQVVAFFTQYYLEEFQRLNLFELLDLSLGLNGGPTTPYLLAHLSHMNGLVRNLIAFQETLWHEGPDRLVATLFLGMRTRNGKQRSELEQALHMLGPLSESSLTPQIALEYDPHSFQVSYGQHGLSLTSIPDFFRESNSSMTEYIHHQCEWYGNQLPAILPNPSMNVYGQNRMPVHNSGEMERLVCDSSALNYQPGQPYATNYGCNLIGRVIRETEGIDDTPDWGNGAHPAMQPPPGPNGSGSSTASGHSGTSPAGGPAQGQSSTHGQSLNY